MRMRNSSRNMLTTQKEYEVADILLCLPMLISCSSPTFGIASLLSSSVWGSKRKRSDIYDDKQVVVVNNNKKIPATTPSTMALIASHSHQPRLQKQRRDYESKIKTTKQKLLDNVDMLTECRDVLRRIGVVSEYYDKLLRKNTMLNGVKQQLKKCDIEEGKTRIVTKSLKKCETDAATAFPSQQDMEFTYPRTQGRCQALPPKDCYPLGGNPGLNRSCNGLAIGRAMDPSTWPHAYELEGRMSVGQVNKCQGNETRKRRMIEPK